MKFFIVEPFPLSILIPLLLNIRLRILLSNTLCLHPSQTYGTTGNVVLCILISKFLERSREDNIIFESYFKGLTKFICSPVYQKRLFGLNNKIISYFKSTFYCLVNKLLICQ